MHSAYFRFYEELNDCLPGEKRKVRFCHNYTHQASVKDMIESLGIPHTEVDLILVNGASVGFDYLIKDGDEISVYPVFESLDISDVQHLRPQPLREPKFVADVHLGKLTRYLRMMGFDVLYRNNIDDEEIVKISVNERRAILTKDLGILKRNAVTHGHWVRSNTIKKQVTEVINRFDLKKSIKEFTLCIDCNQALVPISKSEILDELPQKVAESQTAFSRCPSCNKNYWMGTHYQKMHAFIQSLKTIVF